MELNGTKSIIALVIILVTIVGTVWGAVSSTVASYVKPLQQRMDFQDEQRNQTHVSMARNMNALVSGLKELVLTRLDQLEKDRDYLRVRDSQMKAYDAAQWVHIKVLENAVHGKPLAGFVNGDND